MLAALAPSTLRMRVVQWKCYSRFCSQFGLKELRCSDCQLSLYATFISQFMTYTSVSNYLQAVIWGHKLNGLTPPSVSSDLVHITLLGICRKSTPPRPKDPMTIRHLKLMYKCIDLSKCVNVMFWACIFNTI